MAMVVSIKAHYLATELMVLVFTYTSSLLNLNLPYGQLELKVCCNVIPIGRLHTHNISNFPILCEGGQLDRIDISYAKELNL